jgi:alpha-mannosidase
VADLPPVGYRVFSIRIPPDAQPYTPQERALAGPSENEWLAVQVDPRTGWISSLAVRGVEVGRGALAVPLVMEDPSDTWSHGIDAFPDVIGRFDAQGNVALIEDGPVRQVVRARAIWGDSSLTADFALYHDLARLDCSYAVNWREQHRMLKLAYATQVEADTVCAEIPGGFLARLADGTEQPCQQWVDLTGRLQDQRTAGLSVLNDSLYGYDAQPGEIRMTVLRSPIFAFHQPREVQAGVSYRYTDQGTHRFRLALLPHDDRVTPAEITQHALALNTPCTIITVPRFQSDATPETGRRLSGTEAPLKSWAQISPPSVVMTALKPAEDGSGSLVLRARETSGQAARALLRIGSREWTGEFQPFQLRTWRVPGGAGAGDPVEVDLLERA